MEWTTGISFWIGTLDMRFLVLNGMKVLSLEMVALLLMGCVPFSCGLKTAVSLS